MSVRRVLVDAAIVKPGLGGLRTYVRGLVDALAGRDDVGLHVVTSCPDDFDSLERSQLIECSPATRHFVARTAWRERTIGRLIRQTEADLLLVPYPEMTVRPLPIPTVMVVHDVRALVAPRYETAPRRLRFRLALGRACRVATSVVCVSEFTAMSLDASVGIDPSRLHVIGEAAPPPPVEASAPFPANGPERPYVLYVGSLLPHKNVETLIRAFALEPMAYDLVLAGPGSDRQVAHVRRLVNELGCTDRVRHVGWLDDGTLSSYYAHASAIVLPSLHEGFGLPVLEGMQAGVPVVASDIPPFREVAGPHATLVERPRDPLAWRDAINAVLFDATSIGAARMWAGRTTWTDIAADFVKLFAELPAGPRP